MGAIDAEERQLEVAGPLWRPPTTAEVLRGLPFFKRLPELAMNTMLRGKVRLRSYRANSVVRPKGEPRRWQAGLPGAGCCALGAGVPDAWCPAHRLHGCVVSAPHDPPAAPCNPPRAQALPSW
jgi:hypothetical protein